MTSKKKTTVVKTQKRVSDSNASSLAVTPTDKSSSSPKRGRNEVEATVKTSAKRQLASVATGITSMNERRPGKRRRAGKGK